MSEPTKGSAAQMRDELLNCKTLFRSLALQVGEWRNAANNEILLIDAAIAAPRKNCERFQTEEEAFNAWKAERGFRNVKLGEGGYGMAWAFTRWLFAEEEVAQGSEARG